MISRRRFLEVVGAGAAALALAACTGTNGEEPNEPAEQPAEDQQPEQSGPVSVRTTALKGPTAMGLVRFMSEVDAGNLADNDYSFQIVASPDEVTPLIAKGETDIAAVPANLASVLYNKTEKGVASLPSTPSESSTSASSATASTASLTSRARPSTRPARAPRPSTALRTFSRRTVLSWAPMSRLSGRASTPSASRRWQPPRGRPWQCCRSRS